VVPRPPQPSVRHPGGLATGLAFYRVRLIAKRGSSYRPEIFHAVVQMIAAHP
jgi:hypothetical protein